VGCGRRDLKLWYYFGEVHDYHFRNLLNHLWKELPFLVIPRKFSSITELEDSLLKTSSLPDIALVYPSTVKAMYEKGRIVPVDTSGLPTPIPNYCEFGGKRYCWPLFKSFVGFYLNLPLAKSVGLDTTFTLEQLLNLESEYVVLGLYLSATLYTAFTFVYVSEGIPLKDACVEAGKFYYELMRRPYVRLYPSPYRAQEDMILERIVFIPGTSAYAPYIEREGIELKFVPLRNSKGESVLFLSGPDIVLTKDGNSMAAHTFVKALYEALKEDTVWRRFGYIPAVELPSENLYHDMGMEVPRERIRKMLKTFIVSDTLPREELGDVCERFRFAKE